MDPAVPPDYAKLPPDERAACYREFAAQVDLLAEAALKDNRTAYRFIAAQWRALADELDTLANRPIKASRNRGAP